ncbi:MAG: hypothetical protein ACOY3K_00325 [Candidatus Omnitrophota bacterium]
MGLETFPEIESFQKLPRRVIVKGGSSSYSARDGAELRGIVINNIGHAIRNLKINLVVFDEQKIPAFSTSVVPAPASLPQGGMSPFIFQIKDYSKPIADYHLYADWNFED